MYPNTQGGLPSIPSVQGSQNNIFRNVKCRHEAKLCQFYTLCIFFMLFASSLQEIENRFEVDNFEAQVLNYKYMYVRSFTYLGSK
jgi:hypothetical protein